MTQQDETRLGEINALLGRGTEYEGKLCFEGRVRIDGKFRGEIHSDDLLILGDGADVDAVVRVGKLIVRGGVLAGKVVAAQLVELFAPARVHADIETPLFFVDRGVVFDGRCTMGGAPAERLLLDDSAARPSKPLSDGDAERASIPEESRDSDTSDASEATEDGDSDAGTSAEGDPKPKRRRTRKSKV